MGWPVFGLPNREAQKNARTDGAIWSPPSAPSGVSPVTPVSPADPHGFNIHGNVSSVLSQLGLTVARVGLARDLDREPSQGHKQIWVGVYVLSQPLNVFAALLDQGLIVLMLGQPEL